MTGNLENARYRWRNSWLKGEGRRRIVEKIKGMSKMTRTVFNFTVVKGAIRRVTNYDRGGSSGQNGVCVFRTKARIL